MIRALIRLLVLAGGLHACTGTSCAEPIESVALTRGQTAPFDGALMPREAVRLVRQKLAALKAKRAEADALRRLVAARDTELAASRQRADDAAKVAVRAETSLRAQKKRNAFERGAFFVLSLFTSPIKAAIGVVAVVAGEALVKP